MTKSMSSSRGFKALISLIAVSALFVFSACMENENSINPGEGFKSMVENNGQVLVEFVTTKGTVMETSEVAPGTVFSFEPVYHYYWVDVPVGTPLTDYSHVYKNWEINECCFFDGYWIDYETGEYLVNHHEIGSGPWIVPDGKSKIKITYSVTLCDDCTTGGGVTDAEYCTCCGLEICEDSFVSFSFGNFCPNNGECENDPISPCFTGAVITGLNWNNGNGNGNGGGINEFTVKGFTLKNNKNFLTEANLNAKLNTTPGAKDEKAFYFASFMETGNGKSYLKTYTVRVALYVNNTWEVYGGSFTVNSSGGNEKNFTATLTKE